MCWIFLNVVVINMSNMPGLLYVDRDENVFLNAPDQVPTYPSGMIGFAICSTSDQGETSTTFDSFFIFDCVDPAKPVRSPSSEQESLLQYYSSAMHVAGFTLPAFLQRKLDQK